MPSRRRRIPGGPHRSGLRGSAIVEYAVITTAALGALLMPFGTDERSVLKRLIESVQQEQAGLLYAASLPALPRGAIVAVGSAPPAGGAPASADPAAPAVPLPPESEGGTPGADGGGGGTEGAHSGGGPSGNGSGSASGDTGVVGTPGTGGESPTASVPGSTPQDPSSWVDEGPDGPALGEASCDASGVGSGDGGGFTGAMQPTQIAATHVGNPIHVVTGNKVQREVDLVPGDGRDDLGFFRHYNSRSAYRGGLGPRWRHAFEAVLKDEGDVVRLWQADGRRIDFQRESVRSAGTMPRRLRATQHSDGTLSADVFGYRWHWRNGTQLEFGPDARLRSIWPVDGHTLRLRYDAQGRLHSVTGVDGRALYFAYRADGLLDAVADQRGRAVRYRYDPLGNLVEAQRPAASSRRYHYEDVADPHRLTGMSTSSVDPSLWVRTRTWTYDGQGRAVRSEDPNTRQGVSLVFGPERTEVLDETQGSRSVYRTRIDPRTHMPLVTAIEGAACSPCAQGDANLRYGYTEHLQLAWIDHDEGHRTEFRYDDQGRLQRVLAQTAGRPLIDVAAFSYHQETDQPQELRVRSVYPGHWRRLEFEYDAQRRLTRVTEHGYAPEPDGRFVPISRTQRVDYGSEGRRVVLDGVREDVQDLTQVHWDREGLSQTQFPGGGRLSVLAVDALGRAARVQVDDREPLDLEYGPQGRVIGVRRGTTHAVLDYGADDRLGALTMPGRRWAMPSLRSEPRLRQGLDRSRAWQAWLPEAVQARHFTVVSDARGVTTRTGFDDWGRRVFVESPDSGTTRYRYDGEGRLTAKIEDGRAPAHFAYDPAGRLAVASLGRHATRFRWDGHSTTRVSDVRSDEHRETLRYDADGRVAARVLRWASNTIEFGYRYDDRGRLIERRLPDGRRLAYRYAADGNASDEAYAIDEIHRLGAPVPLLRLWNAGPPDAEPSLVWRTGNGMVTRVHQSAGRLTGLQVPGLHDLRYRYAERGVGPTRIVAVDDGSRPVARYRYDREGRLDFGLTPTALFGYRYDANGNRERVTVNGQSLHSEFDRASNRSAGTHSGSPAWHPPLRDPALAWLSPPTSLAAASQPVVHAAGGEIVRLGDLRMVYGANGQLESIERGGVLLARYRYNSRAERIAKIRLSPEGSAMTEHFVYERGRLVAEADPTGRMWRHYLYLGHHPVLVLEPGHQYAVHTNHLGAPLAVTDERRVTVWRARYAPFGRAQIDEDPDGDGQPFHLNLRFPGQYEDVESGLHYNHHRYYDPDSGRYLSPDPLGLAAGPNPYVYAGNDPVNFIDPSGLLLFAFDGTGNNAPPDDASDFSNVVKFRDSYVGNEGEMPTPRGLHYYYMSGPDTLDVQSGISGATDRGFLPDGAVGSSMPARIAKMADYFFDYIAWLNTNRARGYQFDIDIVGFSRGAASARVFANLLSDFLAGKSEFRIDQSRPETTTYRFDQGNAAFARRYMGYACIDVGLRFLGLWDTVPHFGVDQRDDLQQLALRVPGRVEHAAHAVAVNEDREDFHAVSILQDDRGGTAEGPLRGAGTAQLGRIERGFIGAHSDIGGGYAEGDLSDVALMWMVQQAEMADARFDRTEITRRGWNRVDSPVLHDSVGATAAYGAYTFDPGRDFMYLNRSLRMRQREWKNFGINYEMSLSYADTRYLEDYEICNRDVCQTFEGFKKSEDSSGNRTLVGMLPEITGMKYAEWLKSNYNLDIKIQIDPDRLRRNGKPKAWDER